MKLLAAYEEGDAEEIKRAAQSSTINHLDHVVCLLISLVKRPTIAEISAMLHCLYDYIRR
jgi:hypothetical protein